MIITAILIKIESKGPVLFKQKRIGKGGKTFNIYKFRSMCIGAEKIGSGVYSDDKDFRVTKVGKFIRASSIDELPQLFNILIGDMSLIGPRPPLEYHPWTYDKYTKEQLKMFNVRGGITGWAQINGRKDVEWIERIKLNVWYVENISFLLDVKIFFNTIFKVFKNADNLNTRKTLNSPAQEQLGFTNSNNIINIKENITNNINNKEASQVINNEKTIDSEKKESVVN